MRERKIEPKPVSNTHPNPVTSTPLGYNAQSAPKGEVEMRKRRVSRHRSLRESPRVSGSRGWGDRGWPQKNKENHTRDGVEKKRRRPDGLG